MTYQKVSASGLVINKKGQILLLKRADNDDFLPGVYGLPGGGTDFMEDPAKGLEREIQEECGIRVDIKHPLTAFSFSMPHEGVEKHTVEIVYLCYMTKKQKIKLSFEHSEYIWSTFEEISQLSTTEFMINLIANLKNHPLLIPKYAKISL